MDLKRILSKILDFTTGLGFYGLGLLIAALVFWFFLKGQFWANVGSGFFGAFIFKNWQSIVNYFRAIRF